MLSTSTSDMITSGQCSGKTTPLVRFSSFKFHLKTNYMHANYKTNNEEGQKTEPDQITAGRWPNAFPFHNLTQNRKNNPAQSVAVKPDADLFLHDSIMHLCRQGPQGRVLFIPRMGPQASLSCLMYSSWGPLPIGVGLPPEARLNWPAASAVFAACQAVCFTGFISGRGGLHMGSVFYCHWLSAKPRDYELSDSQ